MSRTDTKDEIRLSEVARTLRSRWGLVLALTLAGTLATALVAGRQAPQYRAQTTLMPIDTTGDRLAPGTAAGGLGGLLSQAGMNPEGTISDKLVALLRSRTLAEGAIAEAGLTPALLSRQARALPPEQQAVLATETLRRSLRFATDPRAGLLTITAQARDPVVAATCANAMVDALARYLQANAFTSVKRKLTFLETKVAGVSQDLAGIEQAIMSFQERHQLVALDAQTQATVQAYATLKNQLMSREVELQLQEGSVSRRDLALLGLRQEVSLLRRNVALLERGRSGGFIGFTQLPRLQLQLARLQRDLTTKQKSYDLLSQQLELAKIEEARDAFTFQVIDRAIPAPRPTGSSRSLVWLLGLLASFVAASLVALAVGARRPSS